MLKTKQLNKKLYYLEYMNKSSEYSKLEEFDFLKDLAEDIFGLNKESEKINPRYYENDFVMLLEYYKNINSYNKLDKIIEYKIKCTEMIICLIRDSKIHNTEVSIKVFTHYIDHSIFDNADNNVFIDGSHPGGLCIVSEIGRELIIYPDRKRVNLSGDNGSELICLPMNSEVISNKDTEVMIEGKTVKYLIDGTIDVIKTFGSIDEFNIRYNNVFEN